MDARPSGSPPRRPGARFLRGPDSERARSPARACHPFRTDRPAAYVALAPRATLLSGDDDVGGRWRLPQCERTLGCKRPFGSGAPLASELGCERPFGSELRSQASVGCERPFGSEFRSQASSDVNAPSGRRSSARKRASLLSHGQRPPPQSIAPNVPEPFSARKELGMGGRAPRLRPKTWAVSPRSGYSEPQSNSSRTPTRFIKRRKFVQSRPASRAAWETFPPVASRSPITKRRSKSSMTSFRASVYVPSRLAGPSSARSGARSGDGDVLPLDEAAARQSTRARSITCSSSRTLPGQRTPTQRSHGSGQPRARLLQRGSARLRRGSARRGAGCPPALAQRRQRETR